MPSLKEVRNRIESVQSTQQITNAMKMVAASKLRKAQDAIVRLRPYARKLNEIINNITETLESPAENQYGPREEPSKRVLIIAISSNKGLCGAFNANVIKEVDGLLKGTFSQQMSTGRVDIICLGKKVYEACQRKEFPVVEEHNHLLQKVSYEDIEKLCNQILEDYLEGLWGKVVIVYNQFRNAAVQRIVAEDFLPVSGMEFKDDGPYKAEYLYEPPKEMILNELIPKSLRLQFFKTILDSVASEQGARMTAMHKATDNANEMLKELRLTYNKARQASITREIIEIVSGAEALKG
jgi:F-type H+-transporting ATPase subunit gamma